jgi:hypothetical protein
MHSITPGYIPLDKCPHDTWDKTKESTVKKSKRGSKKRKGKKQN